MLLIHFIIHVGKNRHCDTKDDAAIPKKTKKIAPQKVQVVLTIKRASHTFMIQKVNDQVLEDVPKENYNLSKWRAY